MTFLKQHRAYNWAQTLHFTRICLGCRHVVRLETFCYFVTYKLNTVIIGPDAMPSILTDDIFSCMLLFCVSPVPITVTCQESQKSRHLYSHLL